MLLARGIQRSDHCLQRDGGTVIVNRPDIQLLVLVQTFIDLGISVAACDDPLADILNATRFRREGYENGTSTHTMERFGGNRDMIVFFQKVLSQAWLTGLSEGLPAGHSPE